jgi:DNA repair protein RadA/Sms
MKKNTKTSYVCTQCGQDYPRWQGKCDNCGIWDCISEFRGASGGGKSNFSGKNSSPLDSKPLPIIECQDSSEPRFLSGFKEMDRVLGGGLVKGAFILLGGDPGIGKSTLMLQLSSRLASASKKVMYVSGEESPEQVSMRARRLKCKGDALQILPSTSVEVILSVLAEHKPEIVIIDSIQTIHSDELESSPGSVAQIRESTSMLLHYAKSSGTIFFLIGHVTKDGAIAGPRMLEHMVDTVLYFEGDPGYDYRIVRAVKNRFGPSGEIAVFSMSDGGLSEVKNASEFFLTNRGNPQIGTSVSPVLEGSRILVVELQALVNKSHFGMPQRVANGINQKRLALLLAVLERHGGLFIGDHDIFFNIAGGLSVSEPSIDLSVAASVISSFVNKPLRADCAFIGEIGLGGEVRTVSMIPNRLKELAQMGFRECIIPYGVKNLDQFKKESAISLIPCRSVAHLQNLLF